MNNRFTNSINELLEDTNTYGTLGLFTVIFMFILSTPYTSWIGVILFPIYLSGVYNSLEQFDTENKSISFAQFLNNCRKDCVNLFISFIILTVLVMLLGVVFTSIFMLFGGITYTLEGVNTIMGSVILISLFGTITISFVGYSMIQFFDLSIVIDEYNSLESFKHSFSISENNVFDAFKYSITRFIIILGSVGVIIITPMMIPHNILGIVIGYIIIGTFIIPPLFYYHYKTYNNLIRS